MKLFFFNALLLILTVSQTFSQTKIISTGDVWQYYDETEVATDNWEKSDNHTKNWKKGISPLGYGDSAAKTVLKSGNNPKEKDVAKFFKKEFRLDNPYQYLSYSLNVLRDDGAVVYLNGREIMRSNMPVGKITSSTLANSLVVTKEAENYFHKKLLLPDDFKAGINILSVSIHKARRSSIDCIFDLELIGITGNKMLPDIAKERTIRNLSFEIKLKELNHKQELKNKDLQYKLLDQSKSSIKGLLYGFSILFTISLICLFYSIRFFSSKNKKLEEKLVMITESNQNKDREMLNASINSINNQQSLKTIKSIIEDSLDNNLKLDNRELKNIINQIEYNVNTNENWENLKKHFNAIHLGYYDKLISLYPTLSDIELRHCIFIKLFMQTKEIASILNIDPKSVQASRYRIKKKMELDESIDLRDYLIKI